MTVDLAVPDRVAARAVELLGGDASAWTAAAPRWVQDAAARWELDDLVELPRGRSSWLLSGQSPNRAVVVKVPYTGAGEHAAAQIPFVNAGLGAPLIGVDDHVIVAGRVDGTPLDEDREPLRHLGVVAEQLAAVSEQLAPTGTPALETWLRERICSNPIDVAPGTRAPTRSEALHALQSLHRLHRSGRPRCCHGDLNPGNVIDGDHLWFLDARGVAGDVAYDLATFAVKAAGDPDRARDALSGLEQGQLAARAEAWVPVIVAARV